jgi:hypothetical protein
VVGEHSHQPNYAQGALHSNGNQGSASENPNHSTRSHSIQTMLKSSSGFSKESSPYLHSEFQRGKLASYSAEHLNLMGERNQIVSNDISKLCVPCEQAGLEDFRYDRPAQDFSSQNEPNTNQFHLHSLPRKLHSSKHGSQQDICEDRCQGKENFGNNRSFDVHGRFSTLNDDTRFQANAANAAGGKSILAQGKSSGILNNGTLGICWKESESGSSVKKYNNRQQQGGEQFENDALRNSPVSEFISSHGSKSMDYAQCSKSSDKYVKPPGYGDYPGKCTSFTSTNRNYCNSGDPDNRPQAYFCGTFNAKPEQTLFLAGEGETTLSTSSVDVPSMRIESFGVHSTSNSGGAQFRNGEQLSLERQQQGRFASFHERYTLGCGGGALSPRMREISDARGTARFLNNI